MKPRNAIIISLAMVGVPILAFLLRGVVQEAIIIPLAKIAWLVNGYYGAFPQIAYWVIALGIGVLIATLSVRLPEEVTSRQREKQAPLPGSVREMSFWIQRSKGGIYPKWHVAHLLVETALDILDRRGTRHKNARQITDPDWDPPDEVKNYMDAALTTNYTDYPKPKRFRSLPLTPFDQDLEPVIQYLESLLESENDHHS